MEKVAPKFLSESDEKVFGTMPRIERLTCIWAVKEAVFKVFGSGLPFRDIKIRNYDPVKDKVVVSVVKSGVSHQFTLTVLFINKLVLAYVLK